MKEETEKQCDIEKYGAIQYAGWVHYQICNGGFNQMAMNGYADELEDYGFTDFIEKLKEELIEAGYKSGSKEYVTMVTAMEYVTDILDKTVKRCECNDCAGTGTQTVMVENEDDDGEIVETEETEECSWCNGRGYFDCDRFSNCDKITGEHGNDKDDFGVDDIDNHYYDTFDSEVIDDVTNQSHNHSVVLDMLQSCSEQKSA